MTTHAIIEPFRVHTVEAIAMPGLDEREEALRRVHYNLFGLRSEEVIIDLLTDSGTGAMSTKQWAGMMLGDESYAGSRSFFRFENVVRDLTGYSEIIPTHQGRAAEKILFTIIAGEGDVIPTNTHFDTTRANIEYQSAVARDLVRPEGLDPSLIAPFKGNINLEALRETLADDSINVPIVMCTVTNNSGGGQPVSMQNLRGIRALCDEFRVPFILDACRFAENAWFIKTREEGYSDKTPKAIAQEMFSLADGCTMSAKKDGLANIGGFLALNDSEVADQCRNLLILTEGFPTYGGLAGYDLEAVAQGLVEVVDEKYLHYRIRSVEYLGEKVAAAGVPIVQPTGGHAVYLDAKALLPQIAPHEYPAQSLAVELYREGGVRGVEIGTLMFGTPQEDGPDLPSSMELVRLAIPRRMYTQSHIDYVAEVVIDVAQRASDLAGYRIVEQAPWLRHFTMKLEPID